MNTRVLSVFAASVLAVLCTSCGKEGPAPAAPAAETEAETYERLVARAAELEKEARDAVARAIEARDAANDFAKRMAPAAQAAAAATAATAAPAAPATAASAPVPAPAAQSLEAGRKPVAAADIEALEQIRAVAATTARNPYRGAIAFDAESGRVLFEDAADTPCLPASMVKMMDLLLVLEAIERGELKEGDRVAISVRAFKTGGSQVYLDPKERFTLEDLLFALMVQSANDAAVAVAEHAAGSCEAMVERMNARAAALGMKDTRFHSVHGLPADRTAGQLNDVSTPRDMAILARELCRHPGAFKYTSCDFHVFRPGPKPPRFELRTHNPVLQPGTRIAGADGLKTGYTRVAGYSLAASVVRNGRRVVVVAMGTGVTTPKGELDSNASKTVRNRIVSGLVETAFAAAAR